LVLAHFFQIQEPLSLIKKIGSSFIYTLHTPQCNKRFYGYKSLQQIKEVLYVDAEFNNYLKLIFNCNFQQLFPQKKKKKKQKKKKNKIEITKTKKIL